MNGKKLKFKSFKEGDEIKAFPFNQSDVPGNHVPVFKTKDGFIIPESYLNIIGEESPPIQEAKVVKDSDYISKDTIENVKNNLQAKNIIESTKTKSKHTVNGALIGGVIGLAYALMKGNNKLISSAIGILAGGFAGNIYSNYKK
jgi:hypothetical protein|tara:strand:- start:445 stop:876 length:432 start_codon:yes stop_codon:yes gene_type:complete